MRGVGKLDRANFIGAIPQNVRNPRQQQQKAWRPFAPCDLELPKRPTWTTNCSSEQSISTIVDARSCGLPKMVRPEKASFDCLLRRTPTATRRRLELIHPILLACTQETRLKRSSSSCTHVLFLAPDFYLNHPSYRGRRGGEAISANPGIKVSLGLNDSTYDLLFRVHLGDMGSAPRESTSSPRKGQTL